MDPTNPFDNLSAFGSLSPSLNILPGDPGLPIPSAPQQQQQLQPGGGLFGALAGRPQGGLIGALATLFGLQQQQGAPQQPQQQQPPNWPQQQQPQLLQPMNIPQPNYSGMLSALMSRMV